MHTKKTGMHILAWSIFIFSESAMAFMAYAPERWWSFVVFSIPEILLFYSHLALLQKGLSKPRKLTKTMLLIICLLFELLIFGLVVVGMRIGINILEANDEPRIITSLYLASALFRWFLIATLSTAYWLIRNHLEHIKAISRMEVLDAEKKLRLALLERDVAKANTAWQRARLKPHLIFNTLNFVQSRVMDNPEAMQSNRLLSGLLRYSMEEPEEDGWVGLDKEWANLKNYKALHQMRFERPVHIHLRLINSDPELRVPPLVLLSLMENVYKHGEIFDERYPAVFQLTSKGNGWELRISNRKKRSVRLSEVSGIGLESIAIRLKAAYGEEGYTMNISETQETYSLTLLVINHPIQSL